MESATKVVPLQAFAYEDKIKKVVKCYKLEDLIYTSDLTLKTKIKELESRILGLEMDVNNLMGIVSILNKDYGKAIKLMAEQIKSLSTDIIAIKTNLAL